VTCKGAFGFHSNRPSLLGTNPEGTSPRSLALGEHSIFNLSALFSHARAYPMKSKPSKNGSAARSRIDAGSQVVTVEIFRNYCEDLEDTIRTTAKKTETVLMKKLRKLQNTLKGAIKGAQLGKSSQV